MPAYRARLAQDLAPLVAAASSREDRCAAADERARLRERVAALEADLRRARRCIAELRRARDARDTQTLEETSRADAAIRILTRLAFPDDHRDRGCPDGCGNDCCIPPAEDE